MGFSVWRWLRGKLSSESIAEQKLMLWGWLLAAPLGYVAVECGWIVRCVGRQPWTVYGELRTADMATPLPAPEVLASLIVFAGIYSLLLFGALYFGSRIIRKGPNLELPLPEWGEVDVSEPMQPQPDQRPVETQQ